MSGENTSKKRKHNCIESSPIIPVIIPFQSNSAALKNTIFSPDTPRLLSNFALLDVGYNDQLYPSVEHAFQSAKYLCTSKPEYGLQFRTNGSIKSPIDAKKAGSRAGMKKVGVELNISLWNAMKVDVMKALILSKVQRHKVIRDILVLARQNGIKLIHTSRSDLEWGAHLNDMKNAIKRGNNLLGDIYNSVSLDSLS